MNKYIFPALVIVKICLFALFLIISVSVLIITSQRATAAMLKDITIVTDDVLKLGDVFDGLKKNADYVLGPAPQPGEDMVLNARTLYRIAVAMDIPWRPETSAEQVTIRRAATIIPETDVQETLRTALTQEGVSGTFDIHVTGTKDIVLPENMPATVAVSTLRYNPSNNYFEATLVAPSIDKPIRKLSVMGQVERMISIPVLKSSLKNGDVIGTGDIEFVNVSQKMVGRDVVLKEIDLMGFTPRRIAHAGKPLMMNDLERPQIVGRGDMVTLVFADGPMLLTTKGKALRGGAKGDLVQVTNLNSSKSVEGYITGAQEITVR